MERYSRLVSMGVEPDVQPPPGLGHRGQAGLCVFDDGGLANPMH